MGQDREQDPTHPMAGSQGQQDRRHHREGERAQLLQDPRLKIPLLLFEPVTYSDILTLVRDSNHQPKGDTMSENEKRLENLDEDNIGIAWKKTYCQNTGSNDGTAREPMDALVYLKDSSTHQDRNRIQSHPYLQRFRRMDLGCVVEEWPRWLGKADMTPWAAGEVDDLNLGL